MINPSLWLLFGVLNGIVLYWIKPDKSIGGFLGASILGGSGALLGGSVATLLYPALQQMNILLFVVLLMTLSGLFIIISNMVLHRKQLT